MGHGRLKKDPIEKLDIDKRIKRRAAIKKAHKSKAKKLPEALRANLFKKGEPSLNPLGRPKMSDMTLQTKAMMREVLVEAVKETFFKGGVDLYHLRDNEDNPPILRGLAVRAISFIERGDMGILEYISSISGMRNIADDPKDNALKDFLIDTIVQHQALKKEIKDKDKDENIIDVK